MTQETFKYSTVAGYFLQDEPSTDPDTFDYVSPTFRASKNPLTPLGGIEFRSHRQRIRPTTKFPQEPYQMGEV